MGQGFLEGHMQTQMNGQGLLQRQCNHLIFGGTPRNCAYWRRRKKTCNEQGQEHLEHDSKRACCDVGHREGGAHRLLD